MEGKTSTSGLRILCRCMVCALLGGLCGYLAAGARNDKRITALEAALVNGDGEALTGPEIYDLAQAQAVAIKSEYSTTNLFGVTTPNAVSGTGMVLTEDGYILTSYHIVEKAAHNDTEVGVLFSDGREFSATIAGFEVSMDLAVLKIDATGLTPITPGDSDALRVGERVYTEGNNLGDLSFSQSSGAVSALDRTITATIGGGQVPLRVFQLDAAINSGSSGGPVYNERGEVVGVVTAKYTSNGVEGLGFAIPINEAMKAAEELIRDGHIADMAVLGAQLADAQQGKKGALVEYVEPNSSVDRAGLQPGDAITAIDGRRVSTRSELEAVMKSYRAGDTAELMVNRGGETLKLNVVFDKAQ